MKDIVDDLKELENQMATVLADEIILGVFKRAAGEIELLRDALREIADLGEQEHEAGDLDDVAVSAIAIAKVAINRRLWSDYERLRARADGMCKWRSDEPYYESECGEVWYILADKSSDTNKIKYCPFCGSTIDWRYRDDA